MGIFNHDTGFLVIQAPLISTITLILMVLTALLFTLGWQLAVHRRYTAHRWVQTGTVLLNAVIVSAVMVRSYVIYILPGIPARLAEGPNGITTLHALVGLVSMILGIYVVLVGNNILPKGLRFTNYRRIMRISYAFYMAATLLGVVVYVVLYV